MRMTRTHGSRAQLFLMAALAASILLSSPASAGMRWICLSDYTWWCLTQSAMPGVMPGWYAKVHWHDGFQSRKASSPMIHGQCGWVWGPDGAIARYDRDKIAVRL